MRTIFKTKLEVNDFQTIQLPQGFSILHLGMQEGVPCIWYECDTTARLVYLDIYCFGTGFNMDSAPKSLVYVGTVQSDGFVWHYYREQCWKF